ncbi:MAG: hypothetical protein WC716_15210 [Chitinophagaceae bacterium]|jgi:cytidylate kinase
MRNNFIIIIAIIGFASCGPSKVEQQIAQAEQMAIIDSTAKATEAAVLQKVADQKKIEDSLLKIKMKKNQLKHQIASTKTQLRIAVEKLESIKQFKMFRAAAKKEEEVNAQLKVIQLLEEEVSRLETELNEIK